jgi:hypothetical protein
MLAGRPVDNSPWKITTVRKGAAMDFSRPTPMRLRFWRLALRTIRRIEGWVYGHERACSYEVMRQRNQGK